ncbi:hypothetical protein PYK79_34655 [Streptomyces sp. ID05-04B]|uniref:hypothetical protein n=1 Tax=unclassified Streptomyces TaxID=2593676 RepID=UPI00131F2029|nr:MULTISPECIES: hypothetical protein [unclassified Streptomyces]MDX5567402.1 hypothetical protein [Streptomyces sp. ID05-04B]
MGTSLTPEFWERFVVLFVLAMGLTFVLAAVFDSLAVRLLRRRIPKALPPVPDQPRRLDQPRRPDRKEHRTSAHC